MKGHNRTSRNILLIAICAVAIILVLALLIIPYGSRVHAIAIVTDNTIGIQGCYLEKLYPISMIDVENTITTGSNTVIMTVLNANTQTEIFSVNKTEVGVGNCVLDSPKLPNLSPNTELLIRFQLLNSVGSLLAQNETTILYK